MAKDYKISLKNKSELEIEDVLMESEGVTEDEATRFERRLELPISEKIPLFFIIILALVFISFSLRIFYFSVLNHEKYNNLAKANIYRLVYKIPERGLILDRNGKILAENIPSFKALIIKKDFPKDKKKFEKEINQLKNILSLSQEQLAEVLNNLNDKNNKSSYILLKDHLSQKEASSLAGADLNGVFLATSFIRNYPDGKYFSSFLGYLGKPNKEDFKKNEYLPDEWIGKAGVEDFYQNILRGEPGKMLVLRKEKSNEKNFLEIKKPKKGKTINLTIDSELQKFIYKKMSQHFNELGIKKGLALAIDIKNGGVLSFLNYPSFDNNVFLTGDSQEKIKIIKSPLKLLFNKILKGLYPIGSTIKPFLALKGLEEGVVTPKTTIDDRPGYIRIENPYHPEKPSIFRDWAVHGLVNLKKAIAVSCDVYFYYLGGGYKKFKGLGVEKINEILKDFRFDKISGIDLIGEKAGLIPNPGWKKKIKNIPWRIGDTYNLSIGQGDFLATPLELLSAYVALANKGLYYKPHFLKNKKEIVAKINFKEKNWQEVWQGMVDTCSKPYGTGHILADLPFKVAGKSGTAQTKGGRSINSLFVALAPADNPKIALFMMAEDATESHLNVLPIVKQTLIWYYNHRIKK